jgi:hypothetical protein
MKIFNMLDNNCLDMIIGFAGIKEQWKHRFSTDVLPKIEKGWMEVGNGNDSEYGYKPCANCYMYAQSCCGNGILCMNCANDEGVETSIVSFEQIKVYSSMGYFEDYETFKRFRDVSNTYMIGVEECMLKNSPIFKQIQMLNSV